MPVILKVIGGLGLGVIGVVLVFAALLAVGVTINALLVALVWNVLGLHTVFGLAALGFWPCVLVGLAVGLLTGV